MYHWIISSIYQEIPYLTKAVMMQKYDHHHTPKKKGLEHFFFLYMMLHASLNDGSLPQGELLLLVGTAYCVISTARNHDTTTGFEFAGSHSQERSPS
jgi:hypothetical protein